MKLRNIWVCLLVAAFLVTGCTGSKGGEKKEEKTTKTQSKKDEKTTKTKTKSKKAGESIKKKTVHSSAVQKLGNNKMDVVLFLNRAENVVSDVYFATLEHKGKTVTEDGKHYRELPKRFDTKEKIVSHFNRYWSRPLAESLYDNLSTKQINKKMYISIPNVDYPMMISVRNTTVQKQDDHVRVTVNNVTDPAYSPDRTLHYLLGRDSKTKRIEIESRTGTYGKEHFQ
ncbi:DL-endopeptidase inhibitor IseA family protein [Brevibacillus panacihumi]|uniref:DL-endopeptidase inhibitor IseA family protein n=1 Tax=Brevibacillus panacihumi TaxID=497735 RepID=UPI003D1EBF0E